MRDTDGNEARLGDTLRLDNGQIATVVVSLETHEFSDEYL
jgi:hypothetical protein